MTVLVQNLTCRSQGLSSHHCSTATPNTTATATATAPARTNQHGEINCLHLNQQHSILVYHHLYTRQRKTKVTQYACEQMIDCMHQLQALYKLDLSFPTFVANCHHVWYRGRQPGAVKPKAKRQCSGPQLHVRYIFNSVHMRLCIPIFSLAVKHILLICPLQLVIPLNLQEILIS